MQRAQPSDRLQNTKPVLSSKWNMGGGDSFPLLAFCLKDTKQNANTVWWRWYYQIGWYCAFIQYLLKTKTKYWLTQERGVRIIGIEWDLKVQDAHRGHWHWPWIRGRWETPLVWGGHTYALPGYILQLPHTNLSNLAHHTS